MVSQESHTTQSYLGRIGQEQGDTGHLHKASGALQCSVMSRPSDADALCLDCRKPRELINGGCLAHQVCLAHRKLQKLQGLRLEVQVTLVMTNCWNHLEHFAITRQARGRVMFWPEAPGNVNGCLECDSLQRDTRYELC
jgi:hypothetical protein